MVTALVSELPQTEMARPLKEVHWYAAYTCANHEKRVAAELRRRSVEYFLPLYNSVRRWRDRRVDLQLPLFPGYIFVHLTLCDRLRVLQVPGMVRLVSFGGNPASLPDEDVRRIRLFLSQGFNAEAVSVLHVGRNVRVVNGPLTGMQGSIVRRKNGCRLIISFELIQRAIAVDISEGDVTAA